MEDGERSRLLSVIIGLRKGILSCGSGYSDKVLFGCIAHLFYPFHFPQPGSLDSKGQFFCRLSLGHV